LTVFYFILVILALGLILFFVSQKKKEKTGNWIQFFAKGKEEGFSFKEVELLRRLATRSNITDPCTVYTSQVQLDNCIRSMVRGIRMSGESEEQGTQDFLSKLYDYRKKVEMNKPQFKNGISSSRQVSEGQRLRVLVQGTGVFSAEVVKITSSYLTITRPMNIKITQPIMWIGMKMSVYFWREDDAGYVFDTQGVDEVFSKGISSIKVDHSDSLFRTQKRKSIRIRLHKAAFLYLAKDFEDSGKLEMVPGLKCFLDDLSDTGCAIVIGGQATSGMRVKVQFALDNNPICMIGTVRSVTFKESVNRSILHIEAETLPIEMRNHILGEVFGMLPEDGEDELPFRVLDEEAEALNTEAEKNNDVREFAETINE